MDRGPFRTGRPADRKSAPAYRQSDTPQQVTEEPAKPVQHRAPATPTHHTVHEKKPRKRFAWPLVALVLVALIAAGGWFAWSKTQGAATAIDSSKYQAVFFTNGQVYFGKLQSFNQQYLKMTGIFYLQTEQSAEVADSENPQKTTTDQANVKLIKLGDEVHGPQDEMIISRDQVMFYENLKSDGKVAQSIDQYNKSKQ